MGEIGDWLTPAEMADEAGCSASWITSLLNKGKIDGQRKGRQWLIHRGQIQRLEGLRKRKSKVDVRDRLDELEAKLDHIIVVLGILTDVTGASNADPEPDPEPEPDESIDDLPQVQIHEHGVPTA